MRWLLPLCALACGCAETAWCGVRDYRPLVVASSAPRDELIAAAERTARDLGAARVDATADSVDAVLDHDWEKHTRDRLRVVARDGALVVDVRTELEASPGEWIAPDKVCDDYAHRRERAIAERIVASSRPR